MVSQLEKSVVKHGGRVVEDVEKAEDCLDISAFNVIVRGNCGGAELRYTGSGKPQLNLSLAVGRTKDKRRATWFRWRLYGSLAEKVNKVVDKGDRLTLAGFPVTEMYTPKGGGEEKEAHYYVGQAVMLGDGEVFRVD